LRTKTGARFDVSTLGTPSLPRKKKLHTEKRKVPASLPQAYASEVDERDGSERIPLGATYVGPSSEKPPKSMKGLYSFSIGVAKKNLDPETGERLPKMLPLSRDYAEKIKAAVVAQGEFPGGREGASARVLFLNRSEPAFVTVFARAKDANPGLTLALAEQLRSEIRARVDTGDVPKTPSLPKAASPARKKMCTLGHWYSKDFHLFVASEPNEEPRPILNDPEEARLVTADDQQGITETILAFRSDRFVITLAKVIKYKSSVDVRLEFRQYVRYQRHQNIYEVAEEVYTFLKDRFFFRSRTKGSKRVYYLSGTLPVEDDPEEVAEL
jgi:hypothetical protein